MKQSELKALINECVEEVMAETKTDKKKEALKKIQEIVTESELGEEELYELFGKKNPATAEEIDAYLAAKPQLKAHLEKTKTLDKWKAEVAKPEYGDKIRKKETIIVKKGDTNTSFGGGLFEAKKDKDKKDDKKKDLKKDEKKK